MWQGIMALLRSKRLEGKERAAFRRDLEYTDLTRAGSLLRPVL
jgi:hypothetical protein